MAGKRDAYLDQLRNVPLFASLTNKDLQKVSKVSDEISVPGGTTLMDQGQAGREAFVILDGSVTVRRNGKKVATLGPGAVVGELALLDHGPRTATVVTDDTTQLLVLEARRFMSVLDEVPALSHKLMSNMAARIRDLDRQSYG